MKFDVSLAKRLCIVFTVAVGVRINFPLESLFFTFLLSLGSPRDLFFFFFFFLVGG